MTDHPDDPDAVLAPFPGGDPRSPFPPLDPPTDWNAGADAHDLSIAHRPVREHPLAILGRFAFPAAPPPDEEGVAARDRRWTSRAIMIGVVLLLVFNAASIQNWARQQPPGWITATVQQLADVWTAQIAQLGADQPRQIVRDAYRHAQDARFPGQAPPPPA
ncbi:hypothetical protein BH10PSE2_BH10PSE2_05080 [soil metagenome]